MSGGATVSAAPATPSPLDLPGTPVAGTLASPQSPLERFRIGPVGYAIAGSVRWWTDNCRPHGRAAGRGGPLPRLTAGRPLVGDTWEISPRWRTGGASAPTPCAGYALTLCAIPR